nr:MAG TPA: hypothetical protein [Caudoviricetes sp.]
MNSFIINNLVYFAPYPDTSVLALKYIHFGAFP